MDEVRAYLGERTPAGPRVLVTDAWGSRPLRSRSHDPLASFAWARPGPSSRELAWALLFDATGSRTIAADWCSDFTAEVVTHLPRESFALSAVEVLDWLDRDRDADAGSPLLRVARPAR